MLLHSSSFKHVLELMLSHSQLITAALIMEPVCRRHAHGVAGLGEEYDRAAERGSI